MKKRMIAVLLMLCLLASLLPAAALADGDGAAPQEQPADLTVQETNGDGDRAEADDPDEEQDDGTAEDTEAVEPETEEEADEEADEEAEPTEEPASDPIEIEPADEEDADEEDEKLLKLGAAKAEPVELSLVDFFVEADADAGLGGRVSISLQNGSGTIYLPGSADLTLLGLSWTHPESVTVSDGEKEYECGEAPLPAVGETLHYTLTSGEQSETLSFSTMQGSAGVAGMFLEIDESMGTISAMMGDRSHNTSCYGTVGIDGGDYFMSIKGRGNYTWTASYDKRPFNMTLYKDNTYDKKKNAELIPGVEAKKWSLLANAEDSSLLRNRLGYYLASALGIGLPTRFVDVWMNGRYIGNYLMTQKTDTAAPKNGYQIEIDNQNDNEDPQFRLNGFGGNRAAIFTVKDNGADVETKDIQAYMQKAADALLDTRSSNYLQYIDLDSWAKMYLLNEFYKDVDVISGSIFMHRDGLSDSDKLIAGPVWDKDVSTGRTRRSYSSGLPEQSELSATGWYIDDIPDGYTAWFQVLGRHADFMQRVYEIYNEYRGVFDGAVAFLESEGSLLAESAHMNFLVSNIDQTNTYDAPVGMTIGSGSYVLNYVPTGCWEDYLVNLMTYTRVRTGYFADCLGITAPTGSITGESSYIVGQTVALTADCVADSYQWQSSADGVTWVDLPGATGAGYSDTAVMGLNGISCRCVATDSTGVIQTQRVAKVGLTASAVLPPVTLAVTMEGHEHSYAAAVTPPSCTEQGYTTFSCICGESYTGDYTDPTDHSFTNPVFTWGNDYSCTAVGRCSCGETAPLECTVTSAVTKAATSLTTGTRTYTAKVVLNGRSYTSTKTETIPRTGGSGGSIITTVIRSIVNTITSIFSSIFRWR